MRSQNKEIKYKDILYSVNTEENTAGVIGCTPNIHQIYIPRTIDQDSKEYDVTIILTNAFKKTRFKTIQFSSNSKIQTIDYCAFSYSTIKSITIPSSVTLIGKQAFYGAKIQQILFLDDSQLQTIDKEAFRESTIECISIPQTVTLIGEGAFYSCENFQRIEIPNDSKLHTIEKHAFLNTIIESITIPSNLVDLKEEWHLYAPKLTKIAVSPMNKRYCCYEDKMIIGKTSVDQSNYDCIVFCVRDIQNILIPNFIEHICSYSFYCCSKLTEIKFTSDSKLHTIGKNAFFHSEITSIAIPPTVTFIGERTFADCYKLQQIDIPNDSKLQTIDNEAFLYTKIDRITIPSELIELKEGWCSGTLVLTKIAVSSTNPRYRCYENKMIIGKSNIDQNNYDCLVFCVRNIKHVKIPNFIEHICSCAFEKCRNLEIIEITLDSKLQTIGVDAFSNSAIKSIRIPASVTLIEKDAFSSCEQLERVQIENNSKLQTIGADAFTYSSIESITIPSSVTFIGENAFFSCDQLRIIEVNNIEMIKIYKIAFNDCIYALLMIPVHS